MSDLALFNALKEELMATAHEIVEQVTAQANKAEAEILAKIDELKTKINDGTVAASDLDALRSAVQGVDDIVPDAPAEPPAVPPAEPPAEPPVV